MTNSSISIAAHAAEMLEGTTDSLEDLVDRTIGIDDDTICTPEFLQALDTMVFCCAECGWWHRQRENATPDGDEWICQECFK